MDRDVRGRSHDRQVLRRSPGSRIDRLYITHGLGERVGFLTTWLSFSYYLFFVPLLLAAVGIYGSAMATDVLHANIDWWIWSLIAAAIVTTLAIVGIGLSMRIDLTLAIVCDGFLLLVSLIIIAKVIGDGNFTLAPLSPSHAPSSFTGLSLALAFGILIFLGFEQSFVLGEEVNDPHGNVPKAIYTALGLIGAVLFLATFAMILGFGSNGIGRLNALVASQGTPWFALVKARLGQGWVDILEVLIVLSILSNTIASTNSVVRIQYGMGRARALPRQLGWTLPSRRTPYVAIGMTMSLSLAITLIAGSVWTPTSLFAFGGFAIGFAAAVAFIMIALAAVMYFRKVSDGAGWFRNWGVPIIAAVICSGRLHVVRSRPRLPIEMGAQSGDRLVDRRHRVSRVADPSKQAVNIDYAFAEIGETVPPEALATEPHAESV